MDIPHHRNKCDFDLHNSNVLFFKNHCLVSSFGYFRAQEKCMIIALRFDRVSKIEYLDLSNPNLYSFRGNNSSPK